MKLSKLSETLAPSVVLKFSEQVKQLIQSGETVHNLTIGDFDPSIFPIPKQLEDGIVQAYRDGLTGYPSPNGNLDLRKSIKTYLSDFQELDYAEDEILVASGGRPLIYALFLALCDKGDEIVYPVPCWNNNYYTQFVGGKHIIIETKEENQFMPTVDEIAPHIKTATLIALCSPQNPTGTIFRKEELEKICTLVVNENKRRGDGEKKLYILFDQMYSQLVFGDAKHFNPVMVHPAIRPFTITVDAISKSFAATGVRVGWCMAPAGLIDKMKAITTHVGAWAPMPEQKGLAAYFTQKDAISAYLSHFRKGLDQRLQYLYTGVMGLKEDGYPIDAIAPEAAVFLSIKLDLIGRTDKKGKILSTAQEVTDYMLQEAKIALIPFYAFGAINNNSWYRISVGTCKLGDLEKVIVALKKAFAGLDTAGETAPSLQLYPIMKARSAKL